MSLLLKNIKQLVQVELKQHRTMVCGADMSVLPSIDDAFLWIEHGRIAAFGSMSACPPIPPNSNCTVLDVSGRMVLPAWCDSHTHIVFAGSREHEFMHRINGLSYEEIAQKGGGILNSAQKMHTASEEELLEGAWNRLNEMARFGTGAVEIKSGYGLSYETELKMLRVIRRLKEISPLTIKATFLGAHAIPLEYKNNRNAYIDLLTQRLLPQIADESLADFIDVFCDKGFFTPHETAHILSAGWQYGLRPKIHANELGFTSGIQVGVQFNALSVDHLEFVGSEEIEVLRNSDTMPTLLPSTAFFLGLQYAPARQMIDADLPIALASDFNPGSSPSGNMPFVLSLACIQMKMQPNEAINAATLNSAYAMNVHKDLGTIAIGKKANLIITKPIPSIAFIPYSFGSNPVEKTIIGTEIYAN